MMKKLVTAGLLFAAWTLPVQANQDKTWYVYCEGYGHGMNWAVFSRNFWPHQESENYGRRVGSIAEEFFEERHDVPLTGCSGVQFFDATTARYSRDRTVKLHKKMGDRIYFFDFPDRLLPE